MNTHLDQFEESLHRILYNTLLQKDVIDSMLPDAPDIEERWESICQSYLPDGAREFNQYPTASLGWMMFIGMAVAKRWDEDWEMFTLIADFYKMIRDKRGYDQLDEYICEEELKLSPKEAEQLSRLVGEIAEMVYTTLTHESFEPGTPAAFHAYVRCLHQLYFFGSAIQLKQMGYHMTKL